MGWCDRFGAEIERKLAGLLTLKLRATPDDEFEVDWLPAAKGPPTVARIYWMAEGGRYGRVAPVATVRYGYDERAERYRFTNWEWEPETSGYPELKKQIKYLFDTEGVEIVTSITL